MDTGGRQGRRFDPWPPSLYWCCKMKPRGGGEAPVFPPLTPAPGCSSGASAPLSTEAPRTASPRRGRCSLRPGASKGSAAAHGCTGTAREAREQLTGRLCEGLDSSRAGALALRLGPFWVGHIGNPGGRILSQPQRTLT